MLLGLRNMGRVHGSARLFSCFMTCANRRRNGERQEVGAAVLRRILNHSAQKTDVLYRHYVQMDVVNIRAPLVLTQAELARMLGRV